MYVFFQNQTALIPEQFLPSELPRCYHKKTEKEEKRKMAETFTFFLL